MKLILQKAKSHSSLPLARILLNKKVGDTAILKLETKDRVFQILGISY